MKNRQEIFEIISQISRRVSIKLERNKKSTMAIYYKIILEQSNGPFSAIVATPVYADQPTLIQTCAEMETFSETTEATLITEENGEETEPEQARLDAEYEAKIQLITSAFSSSVFKNMQPAQKSTLAHYLTNICKIVKFRNGQTIFNVSDPATTMFLILSGNIRIELANEPIVLNTGEIFGEMGMFTLEPRMASAIAEGDVQLLEIDLPTIKPHLIHAPALVTLLYNRLNEALKNGREVIISKRYKLIKQIGRGGSGIIYLAEDSTTEKKVALKFLSHALLGNKAQHNLFIHEIKTIENLDNPRIVKTHHHGKAFGTQFIAMDYLEGRSLVDLLKERKTWIKNSRSYIKQIAEALIYIYSRDVTHGDIKPENVHISPTHNIKIIDFGIANLHKFDFCNFARAGTAHYMAPEVISGRKASHPADCFALGAIAFELLTGNKLGGKIIFSDNRKLSNRQLAELLKSRAKEIKLFEKSTIARTQPILSGIILGLLDPNPKTRMTAKEVVNILKRSNSKKSSRLARKN